ncbi:hypothetical protein [Flagellimonas zhangzhouensis]|uniref:Uncharacterized protein n=1 Tax=Flagellimonas zhangzhouensis TaxID=1073328 RepID=A0A1H2URJ9_9FLAO|nr:hypothetical protein [Allomuricauda zhangzhouensis]SDQ14916.1 hypothetical protein SAMN05216294_0591 [Allomuricauda zhangzhouensis]SDW58184.1 hypothetical protein SAMN04487892_1701 [Allomuricauda zhangzhouensis]
MKETHFEKLVRIGNTLIEGPNVIFNSIGQDWLEKDLQIIFHYPENGRLESFSIWSDDTMNKEKGFLQPMIRNLTWDRRKDLDRAQKEPSTIFPKVDIQLGSIKKEMSQELNEKFVQLQHSMIRNLEYVPYKIPTTRDSAEIKINFEKPFVDFSVFFRNGVQTLEFSSCVNHENILLRELNQMKKILLECINLVKLSDWVEKYSDLTESFLNGKTMEWNYSKDLKEVEPF